MIESLFLNIFWLGRRAKLYDFLERDEWWPFELSISSLFIVSIKLWHISLKVQIIISMLRFNPTSSAKLSTDLFISLTTNHRLLSWLERYSWWFSVCFSSLSSKDSIFYLISWICSAYSPTTLNCDLIPLLTIPYIWVFIPSAIVFWFFIKRRSALFFLLCCFTASRPTFISILY